jgi:hypothetical protein
MRAVCPRCGDEARAPTVWSSAWRCDLHGEIDPLRLACKPSPEALGGLVKTAGVPVWVPWPLPHGWLVTGFSGAGDERTGSLGTAVALSGPNPAGGPADLIVIAEEPGVGLGAGLAGLAGPDPGAGFAAGPPHATVRVDGHEAPLWLVQGNGCVPNTIAFSLGRPRGVPGVAHPGGSSADANGGGCAAFAGEVAGGWVWLILWPDTAGLMMVESLALLDLRDTVGPLELPFGAPTSRLPA